MHRFSRAERTAHWVAASTFLVMTATGLILYLPVFASLAADRMLWKTLHIGAAVGFWAGLVAVVATSPRSLGRTASQLDRFDDDDRAWLAWAVRRRGCRAAGRPLQRRPEAQLGRASPAWPSSSRRRAS